MLYIKLDARFVAPPPFIDSFRPGLCSVSISGCREDTDPFGHPAINQTKNNYKNYTLHYKILKLGLAVCNAVFRMLDNPEI